MQHDKIPTLTNPISNKAVFVSKDIENTFEREIKQQHINNYKKYIKTTLGKKAAK
ncbi:MAG: hypothetical protein GY804_03810 [Alphaproteobacteria bacterium]|nr:hypothetical protein [Alphaproteobacteria bacterium]